MPDFQIQNLAVPSVYLLILFLGYPSQYLLMHLEPRPLSEKEIWAANVLLVLIFITYTRSVFVDAGRIPRDWVERVGGSGDGKEIGGEGEGKEGGKGKSRKWCRKCDAAKPPRAHHCKECKRCIPKMDHHCPWTNNCVSTTTFPHFLRFLLYTTAGLSLLQCFLFPRILHLWNNLDLPSYLGPTPLQLAHLFTILIANTLTLFVLAVLLLRNIWCLAVNTTTIEGWEIERHRTLVRRARQFGGYLVAPDGVKVRIRKQEFPYDIGIWSNIVEGMGSRNPLNWFNPFARTMPLERGLRFETNGFESEDKVWPPPDPERNYRRSAVPVDKDAFRFVDSTLSREDEVKAFKERQAEDAVRRRRGYEERIDYEVEEEEDGEGVREEDGYGYGSDEAEEEEEPRKNKLGDDERENVAAWRNSEGERLKDFGVDEDVEFYDEQDDDDVPLSELLARKRAASMSTHQNLS